MTKNEKEKGQKMPAVLAVLATVSLVVGNFTALVQSSFKRLMAYSAVSHTGFLLIGLVAATPTGLAAVHYYNLAYAVGAAGVFGTLAAVSHGLKGGRLADLNGLWKRSPAAALLLLVFLLSMAGVPPLAGFFAKFYVFAAAFKVAPSGLPWGLAWLVAIALLTSVLGFFYYLKAAKHMLVFDPAPDAEPIRLPFWQLVPLVFCALFTVVAGIFPQRLITWIEAALAAWGGR